MGKVCVSIAAVFPQRLSHLLLPLLIRGHMNQRNPAFAYGFSAMISWSFFYIVFLFFLFFHSAAQCLVYSRLITCCFLYYVYEVPQNIMLLLRTKWDTKGRKETRLKELVWVW